MKIGRRKKRKGKRRRRWRGEKRPWFAGWAQGTGLPHRAQVCLTEFQLPPLFNKDYNAQLIACEEFIRSVVLSLSNAETL